MEKKLVEFILTNRSARFMSLFEVPIALGWDISEDCVRDALHRQGFNRRHARIKPLLNEKHQQECLKWAKERLNWDIPKWRAVLWTDKTSMQVLGQSRGMVTRRKGEEHNLDCIEPKFKKPSQCNFWGSISGLKGKGIIFFHSFIAFFLFFY
jgi:hypothetical protein